MVVWPAERGVRHFMGLGLDGRFSDRTLCGRRADGWRFEFPEVAAVGAPRRVRDLSALGGAAAEARSSCGRGEA